jgi:predicted secreted protein
MTTQNDLRQKLDLLIASAKSDREESKRARKEFNQKLESLLASMKSDRERAKKSREEFYQEWCGGE